MLTIKNPALRFWILVLSVFCALLWIFKPVLLPFLTGLTIAYFLEPAVSALERKRIPRGLGSFFVLSIFLFIVVSVFFLAWPMLNDQIGTLIDNLPGHLAKIRQHYLPWVQKWLSRFSPEDMQNLRNAAAQSTGETVGLVSKTVQTIVSGGVAFFDILTLSILMPITAFYALRDWKKMTYTIGQLIPHRYRAVVREQLQEIDRTLSGFVRGQAIVCLVLGTYYSFSLALMGLQYGATIGMVAGILTIMPYVGTAFGWISGIILAYAQFNGDVSHIGLVCYVFLAGQVIEGYLLTPRLVGKRVGLHPVWVLFALISGFKLMGFTGALIAVPTASIIGVLVRFGTKRYKDSGLYK